MEKDSVTIEKDFKIPNSIKDVYIEMDISPVSILKKYALNIIHGKIQKYEAENMVFEKKYKCRYDDFKSKVEKIKDDEVFEWDDDLMDWEFAINNLKHWQQRYDNLNR